MLLRQQPESARVIDTSGPAEHAFGNEPYTPLVPGMRLGEGDRVRTGQNGFVTLELVDGSHVSLLSDGMANIGRLRRTALTGATDRVIDLQRGEVDSKVTRSTKKDDRFQIRSPSEDAGVRGTRFRVNYEHDEQETAIEVLDGVVGVDATSARMPSPGVSMQAPTQLVKADFGSVTRAGGDIGGPVELLPAPVLTDPDRIQNARDVAFDIVPASEAAAYRVQIARDADLLDLIRDVHVIEPHAGFGDLPDGTYFVRILDVSTATTSKACHGSMRSSAASWILPYRPCRVPVAAAMNSAGR